MYNVSTHAVEVFEITSVQPLTVGGAMVSPDAGVILGLAGGAHHKWILEKDSVMPTIGAFLVTDKALRITYVVAAKTFAELFFEGN